MNYNTVKDAINRGRITSCRKNKKGRWEVHQIKALQEFHDNKKQNQHTPSAKERREQVLAQSAHAEESAHVPAARPVIVKQVEGGIKDVDPALSFFDEERIPDLDTSKERTEHYKAQKAKAEYYKTAGALVDLKEVEKLYRGIAKTVRDSILKVPDRVSPMLAVETDVKKVLNILDKELREALEFLSEGEGIND